MKNTRFKFSHTMKATISLSIFSIIIGFGLLLNPVCTNPRSVNKQENKKTGDERIQNTLVNDGAWCWFSDPRAIYISENEIVTGYIPNVFIKRIDHYKGYGLFALSNLKKDSFIGVYTGYIRKHKKRLDRKNGYCFEYQTLFSKKTPFTIDAKYGGNYTRFINHSYKPNLSLFLAYCKNIMHIILVTNRDIEKGEELTYDYGENYWKKREKPKD